MLLAAIEALLDEASDALVRELWAALDEVGLPSQARHRGATNAPHVTLVSAPRIDELALGSAVDLLAPLLPLSVEVGGFAVLGAAPRHTLALLCRVPASFVAVVEELGRAVVDPRSGAWVPHVTLGRRLTAAQVGRALEVLAEQRTPLDRVVLDRVRHWDPATRSVTAVS